jgi:hypothetical protein
VNKKEKKIYHEKINEEGILCYLNQNLLQNQKEMRLLLKLNRKRIKDEIIRH